MLRAPRDFPKRRPSATSRLTLRPTIYMVSHTADVALMTDFVDCEGYPMQTDDYPFSYRPRVGQAFDSRHAL